MPTPPVAVPRPSADDLVAETVRQWRAALAAHAGDSALADVDRLGEAQLDLSAAHPSGVAQLFAGRATRLSNLVREGSALAAAKRRARAVSALAEDHAQRYGVASAFLALGVATWTEDATPSDDDAADDDAAEDAVAVLTEEEASLDGAPRRRRLRAPVLLRPVTMHPRGRADGDDDLVLDPSLEVNPLLATALRRRGALLDPTALARGAFTASGFDPRPALDRLRALGEAVLEDFTLEDRLLVGTFVHPGQTLVDDLDALAPALARHEVVAALAGDERAARALAHPLPDPATGDRAPEEERGVGDLDAAQARVLDVLAAGHHLLVDAPPGSDVAGTVAAVVADAAASGRTVLYVAGHRRAARAVTERLAALGLDDLVLDIAPESDWRAQVGRRLLAAMTVEPVAVDGERVEIVRQELLRRRGRLMGYIDGLHVRREPWGVSGYDALQALARLTAQRPAPRTRVRLSAAVAESLQGERRAQAAADLVRAAGLGAFTPSAAGSAWAGADLVTAERAQGALERARRLHTELVPRLRDQARAVADETGLVAAASPAQWGEQLRMLAGVRGALDVFRPLVFERSAVDLVAATATKSWRAEHGVEMSRMVRRRLRKQAKDMVRPGRPVDDLHAALVDVQHQREVWQAHCPAGGWPRIPAGLAHLEADHDDVRADLDLLSRSLATTRAGGDLHTLGWDELLERLRRLGQDADVLDQLPERTALLRDLQRRGLADLLDDLADRRVGAEMVGTELELAWWSTVFEEILRQDPALAGYDGPALTRLVAEFRALDTRHLSDRAVLDRAAAREALRARLEAAAEQAQELFGEVVEERFPGLRVAVERHPDVARHLRPCLVASPVLVPHLLPPRRTEDLVVLDAVGHLPTEAVAAALARGSQVLVIGDTRTASGTALTDLAGVLPVVPLRAEASRRDPALTLFLARHGYEGHLTAVPLPAVEPLLSLQVVDGTGMPSADGAVEGTRAEVERVVDVVIEHALTRPEESLAVVTASAVHAERVREAVRAEVRDNPALARFFGRRTEPFAVVELGATQGLVRDAVVLSVGYGRTPHGRVLHRFGALSGETGPALLLEALGAVRHRLTVISCFRAADLDRDRLRAPGAQLLADLLELAADPPSPGPVRRERPESGPDRLVLDLAERLFRMGLVVDVDHGVMGGTHLPLAVGHPDLPDRYLVAVLTDDDAYVREPSVRVRDRQVPQRLERLGWTVVQVWSAAAFLDPQGEADGIAAAVVEACRRHRDTHPDAPCPEPADLGAADDDAPGTGAQRGAEDAGPRAAAPVAPAVPRVGARPPVEPGLPVGAYTDDQLDDLVRWITSDGVVRDEDALAAGLREELGLVRRGARADTVVASAVRRALRP